MPKLQLNPIVTSLSGSMDSYVYKHYKNDKRGQVLSRKPDMSGVTWSPAQLAHRQRMQAAATFHRQVLVDPVLLEKYTRLAEEKHVNLSAVTMGEVLRKPSS